jgi:exosortase
VIDLGGHSIAVAEACNGMRMVTSSLLVGGVVAFLVQRSARQRVALLLSCIPIALLCNVIRISITALLHARGYRTLAEGVFHSLAGFLTMPVVLLLLLIELRLFSMFVGTRASDLLSRVENRADQASSWIMRRNACKGAPSR